MKITQRFKSAFQGFTKAENTMGQELAREFKRYGNNKALVQDWSKVIITDKDLYTGYPYAAINNRANGVSRLATSNLHTNATPEIIKAARAKEEEVVHPYLDIIDSSKTFSNYKFWYDISTYLDLEGVYYLFALRTVEGERVGNIQEFKLLNPYNIRRIIDKETFKIGGYVETRDGMIREFAPQQIIEMRKLNPFSDEDPFSMTDAAKENQYTMKQAGDYTRHSLKNNMAAPGIISTDVLLDTQQFQNFVSRVTNQEKGLPLFGNGAGAITWDSMQIDMDKAALDKINEIHRQGLFAVSGVGKTMLSIEESGTTRDTARAQKEIFIENHVMPQLQLIIDSLNQDYKVNYESEYTKNKYRIIIDNPLGTDRDAELKDIEIRDESYKLYDKLVAQGYKRELASKFAEGKITLEELGEPTEEARPNPVLEAAMLKAGMDPNNEADKAKTNKDAKEATKKSDKEKKADKKADKKKESLEHNHEHEVETDDNEFDEESLGIINTQQGQLQNTVQGIEARVVASVLDHIFEAKNEFEKESDLITEREKKDHIAELALVLGAFYGVIIPLYAARTMSKRTKEFNMTGQFKLNNQVKTYIKGVASKTAESHVTTILKDLSTTIENQYQLEVKRQLELIEQTRKITDKDLALARRKALEGASRQNIINAVQKEYSGKISDTRAKAIARTETNRAFTQSQYQADIQFIKQNGLEGTAYKKWVTQSTNPCPICQSLAAEPEIPFETNFADLGDELVATYKDDNGKTKVLKQQVNFEDVSAGNAHVNCSCRYRLIIK